MSLPEKKTTKAGQIRPLVWLSNLIGASIGCCTFQCYKYLKLQKDAEIIESYLLYTSKEASVEEVQMRTDIRPHSSNQLIAELLVGPSDIEMRIIQEDLSMSEDEEEEESETDEDVVLHEVIEAAKIAEELNLMQILATNPDLFGYRETASGDTALHQAVRTGNQTVLIQLLGYVKDQLGSEDQSFKYRSLLQTPNNNGDTALHVALKHRHKEMAFELIKEAPDMTYMINDAGISPLYLAIRAEYKDLVEVMVQQEQGTSVGQYKLNKLLNAKKSPTACAIRARDTGILQILLDNIPQLMRRADRKGWFPLSYAAGSGNIDRVSYFLDKFPDHAKISDRDGSFALHKAVAGGHLEVVKKFLLRYPEMTHCTDGNNRTILHVAVEYARPEVLSYLVHEPRMKQIFHLRDHNGHTFADLAKKLMKR